MTGIRRILILIVLTVAVIAGAGIPASATYADFSAVSHTVETLTVQAPKDVSTSGSWCFVGFGAHISWTPSTSPEVTGYTVTEYLDNGTSSVIAQTGPTALSIDRTTWGNGRTHFFTVTTRTSYGWTAESPRTAGLRC
jgi:hypothetical protein